MVGGGVVKIKKYGFDSGSRFSLGFVLLYPAAFVSFFPRCTNFRTLTVIHLFIKHYIHIYMKKYSVTPEPKSPTTPPISINLSVIFLGNILRGAFHHPLDQF